MLSVLCLRSDRRTAWCILSSSAMRSILGGYEAAAQLIRSMSPSFHSTRHDQREEAAASMGTAYLSQAGQVQISNLLMEERRLLGAQQARARPRQAIRHQHSSLSVCKAAYKRHSNGAPGYRRVKVGRKIVLDFLSTCLFGRGVLSTTGCIETAWAWHGRHESGRELCGASREGCMAIPAKLEPRLRDRWAVSR
jgi:hypothetical protein